MPRSAKRKAVVSSTQIRVLRFVQSYLRGFGYGPSLYEIRDHLGSKSHSTAYAALESLERKGYVERVPGVARGIRVLRKPDGTPV